MSGTISQNWCTNWTKVNTSSWETVFQDFGQNGGLQLRSLNSKNQALEIDREKTYVWRIKWNLTSARFKEVWFTLVFVFIIFVILIIIIVTIDVVVIVIALSLSLSLSVLLSLSSLLLQKIIDIEKSSGLCTLRQEQRRKPSQQKKKNVIDLMEWF